MSTPSEITEIFDRFYKEAILLRGYSQLNLPNKIKYMCILFAFDRQAKAKNIPFSTKFHSKKGIELTENNECASKTNYPRKSWVVSDIAPIHHGIHLYRVLVSNPQQELIRFGVSSKRHFSQDTVYGIAHDLKSNRNLWRPTSYINQRSKINLRHFAQKKCAIDMLLDADQGILRLCVVGMCDAEHEAKIWGMPTTKLYQRWVPFFAFGSAANNVKLHVMEIPTVHYGKSTLGQSITNNNLTMLSHLENYYQKRQNKTFTFQCCGIKIPVKPGLNDTKTLKIENINIESRVTVRSKLTGTDTINALKTLMRVTYDLEATADVIIFYSDKVVSADDGLQLLDFGITDGALLVLGIKDYSYLRKLPWKCKKCTFINADYYASKCEMCQTHHQRTHIRVSKARNPLLLNGDSYKSKSETKIKTAVSKFEISDAVKGFDIITQESNVDVYRMPCSHMMNKESLYHYALTKLKDDTTVCLKCPHANEEMKSDEWACAFCTFLNSIDRTNCEMCDSARPKQKPYCEAKWDYSVIKQVLSAKDGNMFDIYKLELLSARNMIQKECDAQKCPKCHTLYYRNDDKHKLSLDELSSPEVLTEHFKTECIVCEEQRSYDTSIELKDGYQMLSTLTSVFEKPIHWQFAQEFVCALNGKFVYGEDLQLPPICLCGKRFTKFAGKPVNCSLCCAEIKQNKKVYHCGETSVDDIAGHEKGFNICVSCARHLRMECRKTHFCWGCGKSWENGHVCKNSFKKDLINILSNAETKKIGSVSDVPSIRCCPNCCQLITHSEACKHMKCESCKTEFCFVCLKPKKGGNWQCGSHSDVCPVAAPQNAQTLPDTIVLNKNTFKLF